MNFNGDRGLDKWGQGLECEKSRDDRRDREKNGAVRIRGDVSN